MVTSSSQEFFKFFRDESHPWPRSIPFVDTSPAELLLRSQAHFDRPSLVTGAPKAWVFDLDSTLYCVAPRFRSIFFEFLRTHPKPPFHWQRAYDFLNPQTSRYNLRDTFEGLFGQLDARLASGWTDELLHSFEPFWEDRFFSKRHMNFDLPYPGAVDFVKAVHGQGYEVVYLTGRDHYRCNETTLHNLRRDGFPLHQRAHVLLKPSREEKDLRFKYRASTVLRSSYSVEFTIDNEPENLVMFARELPQAEVVFFHTTMSRRNSGENYLNLLGDRSPLRLKSFLDTSAT